MHLYVLAKGIKPDLERWQNDLLAIHLKQGKKYMKDGKEVQNWLQLAVRPVQIFEIGFPKESLEEVMSVIGTGDYILKRYPILNMTAKMIRKFAGLKPVPLPKKINPLLQPFLQGKAVAVVPIGIKEDMHRQMDDQPDAGEEQI